MAHFCAVRRHLESSWIMPTCLVNHPVPHEGRLLEFRVAFPKGRRMTRLTLPSSPLLLGFEELERTIERTAKSSGDGYPPYNIERLPAPAATGEPGRYTLRITLAVAGFTRDQLDIELADKQLTIRGKQSDEPVKQYLHRGIAARQFCRTFVLADGLEVHSADLNNGLLSIDLVRVTPVHMTQTIAIGDKKPRA